MKNELDGMKGDASSSFNLATFFPHVSQPSINKISNYCYKLALKFKIVPKFDQHLPSNILKNKNESENGISRNQ